MSKFLKLIQMIIGVLVWWSISAGIALSQTGPSPSPDSHSNVLCWPAPCGQATEDPDDKHDFDYYLTPPRMNWYAEVDGAAITRKPQSNVILATAGTTGNVALSTGGFNYDLQAAGKLLLGMTLNDCFQVEASYYAVNTSANSDVVYATTANLYTPFSNFGTSPRGGLSGLDPANIATIEYDSSFQNLEFNLRRQVPMTPGRATVSILGGIRYMQIVEQSDFDLQTAVAPAPQVAINNFRTHTDNEMIGGQVGALLEFFVENRWWIDFEAKAGVYSDRAKLNTSYHWVTGPGVVTNYLLSDTETHTSFAEDLSLSLLYRWSAHLTTRLGYQALFLQEVALAPDNLGTNINLISTGPLQINHSQGVIYHGPFAGLVFAW